MKTVIEPKNQDSILAQWRGACAQIWIFDVSLKRVAIRIYRPHEAELLYVIAVGCNHITGPFSWDGANLSISLDTSDSLRPNARRVVDDGVGFELRCSDAKVVRGPSTDFDKTFEDFLAEGK